MSRGRARDIVHAVRAKLYFFPLSHPSQAARLMLEHKQMPYDIVNLMPGMHAPAVRLAGFPGWTVPAMKVDGRKVQGSLEISRALEELKPEPPLFPSDAERRRAVEDAERWGEQELQPIPRRFFRWGMSTKPELRAWMASAANLPAPGIMARVNAPVARRFARASRAYEDNVKRDIERLPGLLDRADGLIADGTIGGPERNAADYQIGTSVRALMAFDQLRPAIEGRPCAEHAVSLAGRAPEGPPGFLPEEWLAPLRGRAMPA